ncbi:hypothetical protein [Shimia marina]|uniref:Uncharacterized protein n=1 Tax=Shimia marina TaxID=321267 RepID=A0A0P1EPT8_9RHOB|nr:hypothetical protein [Shimia marina]CUH52075.1 hypothetical protein SHM7688_01515 [Shimia marina]SFE63288.1 hypothetical protein SAMN04488037_1137 [Shimia marina]
MAIPANFTFTSQTGQTLQFQTIDMDLQGYIVSKRVQDCLVSEHPFVTEAKANVHKDQFVSRGMVVFETNFLRSKTAEELVVLHRRSAKSWCT